MEYSTLASSDSLSRKIVNKLLEIGSPTRADLEHVKIEVCREFNADKVPRNSEIIACLLPNEMHLRRVLTRKLVRSISGVAVIAAMTPPARCPHVNAPCLYCPGGPDRGVPQSYTGKEPASMRGAQAGYDPYLQVKARIEQLQAIGHKVSKVELIIMGGTFPSLPSNVQESFVKGCLDATNGKIAADLEEAKRLAEFAAVRNVGITVETRPDWARQTHVNQMLMMGVTRVELGVQNVYDDIYATVNRGHTLADVVEATRIAKDSGLKVVYHLMPGLPGSNPERDLEGFSRVFSDEHFKPDMLKLYPCLVLKGTKLYDWWLDGKYRPYSSEEAAGLIAELKCRIPPWMRIMRVQRDIPANLIQDGVTRSDLRELVRERMKERDLRCRCVRCREVGHRWLRDHVQTTPDRVRIIRQSYKASGGQEFFVSIEDPEQDILVGYLRLRIPSWSASRPEVAGKDACIVRELKVCGPMVPVGAKVKDAWQHRGYGRILMNEAESLAHKEGRRKILVTSALGTRQYYYRFGYSPDGPYVSKAL